ncbi:MAG: GntR family transcriptional regulator [Pseudomonadota bacterium]
MDAIKPKRSLVDETYDALVDSICNGELVPGERLNQDEIALRLNVSRQPVNSALAILRANGFVEDTGRRGVVVAAIQPTQFQSIYEFRAVIEPFAVSLVGRDINDRQLEEAQSILASGNKAVTTGNIKALLHADMSFHEMIYRWSGNHVIENSMRVNWQHIRRSMAEVLKNPDAAIPTWKEHTDIIASLADGRLADASQTMKRHIERAGKATITALLQD